MLWSCGLRTLAWSSRGRNNYLGELGGRAFDKAFHLPAIGWEGWGDVLMATFRVTLACCPDLIPKPG